MANGWTRMVYKYFPPNMTHVTTLPCETHVSLSLQESDSIVF